MVSKEHQTLVNLLAQRLEDKIGVKIVAIDIAGTPQYFEPKYHDLQKPDDRNGSVPDLVGQDADGTNCLGEAETDMEAENLNEQLKTFSSRKMTDTGSPVPLYVIVPERIFSQMKSRIRGLGLGDKLNSERITVWYVKV